MSGAEIDSVLHAIRRSETVTKTPYHFRKHGREFNVATVEEYLRNFRAHLARDDLRVFTYLRRRGGAPFWELLAPDTAATVVYDEKRQRVWSFYRIGRPDLRMAEHQSE